MGNSFGRLFSVHGFGESHGGAVGCVLDGCPAGLRLDLDAVQAQLDRRRPGQSDLVTQRKETDRVQVLSGLQDGLTLGTPLLLLVPNKDARPAAYEAMPYRPSHADYTYQAKFGLRASSGGGRASARETLARVAAGAVARQLLAAEGIEIVAWVHSVGELEVPEGAVDPGTLSEAEVDQNPVRCPNAESAVAMEALIRAVRAEGDTIGGVVRCVARGVPPGWGEPVFDKLDALLAQAQLSLPAAKGFESGSGFAGTAMRGSEHNDAFLPPEQPGGTPRTRSNHSGGIQGGISNGQPVHFAVAFKPVSTIFRDQDTMDEQGRAVILKAKGRHDPCVVPRAVPIVEAMTALVLVDLMFRQRARG